MEIALLIIAVLLAVGAAVGGYLLAQRHAAADTASRIGEQAAANESLQLAIDAAVRGAVTEARLQASAERDAAVLVPVGFPRETTEHVVHEDAVL